MNELLRLVLQYELNEVQLSEQEKTELLIKILTEFLKQKNIL